MKRTPLRQRSKKREALMVKRRALIKQLFEEREGLCEALVEGVCTRYASDLHEKLRRSQGGKIVGGDASDYLIVCRPCHTWIGNNPAQAFSLGLARHSWD